MYKVTCQECNKEFVARKADRARGHAKYCSRKCFGLSKRGPRAKHEPNVSCSYCSKPFYKNPSKLANSKSGLYFCCRSHKDKAQRIGGLAEIQPAHYQGGYSTYRKKALRDLPNECAECGYSKHVGVLTVHHKDRNRSNCDITNLQILCPTCHETEHFLKGDGRYS